MRRAARVDENQQAIVDAFRALGCSVLLLHQVGKGAPDLAVGCRGLNYFVEVKDGNKPPSKRKLTADQVDFHRDWRGQICVVETVQGAVDLVKSWTGSNY